MREQSASRIDLKLNKALALVLAITVGFGAFCVPMKAFASDISNQIDYSYDVSTLNDKVITAYSWYDTGYEFVDFYEANGSVGNGAQYFAIYLPIPLELHKNDVVHVGGHFIYSTGSITNCKISIVDGPTTSNYGMGYTSYSNLVTCGAPASLAGGWKQFSTISTSGMTLTHDANSAWLRICFIGTISSNDWYCKFKELNISVSRPSVDLGDVNSGLGDLNNVSNNIFTNVKNIFSSLGNLPANIKTQLTSLFTNVTTAVDSVTTAVGNLPANIKTQLTSLFTSVKTAVDSVTTAVGSIAVEVEDALSGYISNVKTAVDSVTTAVGNLPANIKMQLTSLFTSVTTAVNGIAGDVSTGLSGFFGNIESGINSLLSDFQEWRVSNNKLFMDEMAKVYSNLSSMVGEDNAIVSQLKLLIGGVLEDNPDYSDVVEDNSSEIDSVLGNIDKLDKPSVDEFPSIEDYAPSAENPFMIIMKRLFALEVVQTMSMVSLVFGFVGYVLFGKR